MDLFSKCKELYEKIRYFEYGIPVDGVIKNVPSAEYYVKNYHFLKPEEFEKYKGGICWDYVEYERKFLEVNDIDFNQYYLITNTPPNYDTHTFITVKDGDELIYIESSFKRVEHIIDGVQKFKSLEDIVKLITTNMWYCNDNDKHFDEFKYDVCKFKGHPQYGCTCEEYMKWMDDNSDIVIQDVSINPKKVNEDELAVEEFTVNKVDTKFTQFVCESANDPEEYDETLHDHIDDEDDVYNESWVDSVDSELIMESQKRRDSYLKKIKYDPKTQTVDTGILDTKTGKNIRIKIKFDSSDPIGAYYQSARSKINEFKTENGYDLNKFLDNVYINMPKDIFNKKKNAGLTVFYHEIGHFLFDLVRYFRDHLNPSDVERLMKWDAEVEKYTASLNEDMVDNLNNHDIDAEEMMADLNATSKVSRHSYDHVHKKSLDQNKNIKGLKKQEKILNSKIEQAKANKDSKQLMKLLNEKDVIDTQNAALREDATSTKARLKANEELTKSLNEPIKEYAIQESWTDFKNGVHPSSGLMFHVSLKNDMDGKTINPQLPSYITDGGELDDNYQEDTTTKRLCVSPSIEGCLIAILNYNKIREHVGDKFYVYTPEKPFSQYKHKTNKEIVKDKLVFDANITKEAWILEPCKLKLYGIIKLKKVKDLKKKPTVEKNIKMNTIKLDYEWIMTPKASGKFNKAIGDSPDKEDTKEKPIKEYDNILMSNDEFFMEVSKYERRLNKQFQREYEKNPEHAKSGYVGNEKRARNSDNYTRERINRVTQKHKDYEKTSRLKDSSVKTRNSSNKNKLKALKLLDYDPKTNTIKGNITLPDGSKKKRVPYIIENEAARNTGPFVGSIDEVREMFDSIDFTNDKKPSSTELSRRQKVLNTLDQFEKNGEKFVIVIPRKFLNQRHLSGAGASLHELGHFTYIHDPNQSEETERAKAFRDSIKDKLTENSPSYMHLVKNPMGDVNATYGIDESNEFSADKYAADRIGVKNYERMLKKIIKFGKKASNKAVNDQINATETQLNLLKNINGESNYKEILNHIKGSAEMFTSWSNAAQESVVQYKSKIKDLDKNIADINRKINEFKDHTSDISDELKELYKALESAKDERENAAEELKSKRQDVKTNEEYAKKLFNNASFAAQYKALKSSINNFKKWMDDYDVELNERINYIKKYHEKKNIGESCLIMDNDEFFDLTE